MTKLITAVTLNRNILVINIDRDLKGTLQKTARAIAQGKNVVIFPEGVRSRYGEMAPFKKLFAILSRELDVPVLPVAISGAYEAMSVGSFFPKRGEIFLSFMKPEYPGEKNYDELTRHVVGVIYEAVQSE